MAAKQNSSILGEAKPSKAIVKLALPATLALLAKAVYNIVDSRYRAGLPVIYTTNLTLEELKNPADMRYARIYDRVLEKCFPVEFRGVSRRKHGARQGFDDMMALLGVDDTT